MGKDCFSSSSPRLSPPAASTGSYAHDLRVSGGQQQVGQENVAQRHYQTADWQSLEYQHQVLFDLHGFKTRWKIDFCVYLFSRCISTITKAFIRLIIGVPSWQIRARLHPQPLVQTLCTDASTWRFRTRSCTPVHPILKVNFNFKTRLLTTTILSIPTSRGTRLPPTTLINTSTLFTATPLTPITATGAPTTTTTTALASTWTSWLPRPLPTWQISSTRPRRQPPAASTRPKLRPVKPLARSHTSTATTRTWLPRATPTSCQTNLRTPSCPWRNGVVVGGAAKKWPSTPVRTTRATKRTPSRATWRPTSEPIPERSRTFAAGKDVDGGLPDQTSWPDTTGNTQETDRSSVDCAKEHFLDLTI